MMKYSEGKKRAIAAFEETFDSKTWKKKLGASEFRKLKESFIDGYLEEFFSKCKCKN